MNLDDFFNNQIALSAEREDLSHHYKLADELEATGEAKYNPIINNLRNNEYSDYNNKKFELPKQQMYKDFIRVDRIDLADKVVNGDFD